MGRYLHIIVALSSSKNAFNLFLDRFVGSGHLNN